MDILIVICYLIASGAICYIFTRKSAMSFGWALFFFIFFSPVIGIVATYANGRYGHSRKNLYEGKPSQKARLFVYLLLAAFCFYLSYSMWPKSPELWDPATTGRFVEDEQLKRHNEYNMSVYKSATRFPFALISFGIGFIGCFFYAIANVDVYNADEEDTQ